jgi:Xaa-Pro aminopeptidase
MKKISTAMSLIFCFFFTIFSVSSLHAQRTGYTKEEFLRRRAALMDKAKKGMIILFAKAADRPGARFRQDNDFYYFTGCEDSNAVLVMTPKTREAVMFLPKLQDREVRFMGQNLLGMPDGKERSGLTGIFPLSEYKEYMEKNIEKAEKTLYIRLSPADSVDRSRWENLWLAARKARNAYNAQKNIDVFRNDKLKEEYPDFEMKDVVPFIDDMRLIKSPEEIAIMRRNGKISAEAHKQAMLATKPGVYEYEIEAAAMYVILKNGAHGPAYAPIVGSGPNSCILHYQKSERQAKAGDLLLMDFGADLDYLCMDITRTWPVSGKFTPEQRDVYQTVLEVQKACIEAYRPGITAKEVREHVAEVLKKKNIDPRGLKGGMHHFVGMSTHDVGKYGIPLKEGMVFTIEPGLYYSDKELGIRIEDTILITKDGCEVLTSDIPKEIDEIEALLSKRK